MPRLADVTAPAVVNVPSPPPSTLSDRWFNPSNLIAIAALIVALIGGWYTVKSVEIAIKTYDSAEEGGKEQMKTLNASRDALLSVVKTATEQQKLLEGALATAKAEKVLLDKNLRVTTDHLGIVKAQVAEEKRRLAQKPLFEFILGDTKATELPAGRILVQRDKDGDFDFDLSIRNIGDGIARRVTVQAIGSPSEVWLRPRKGAFAQVDPNVLKFSGHDLEELEPSKIANRFPVSSRVPLGLKNADVTIQVWAANMPVQTLELHFEFVN
jgi:hypothetical protein